MLCEEHYLPIGQPVGVVKCLVTLTFRTSQIRLGPKTRCFFELARRSSGKGVRLIPDILRTVHQGAFEV